MMTGLKSVVVGRYEVSTSPWIDSDVDVSHLVSKPSDKFCLQVVKLAFGNGQYDALPSEQQQLNRGSRVSRNENYRCDRLGSCWKSCVRSN